MTLEELENEIWKKEKELKELKKRRLFMIGKQRRIFAVPTIRKMFRMHGHQYYTHYPEKFEEMAILEVSDGRTNQLQELTFDEFSKVNGVFLRLVSEYILELDEKEKQRDEDLQKSKELCEKALSDDLYEVFEESIQNAKEMGVPDKTILHWNEELGVYFLGE